MDLPYGEEASYNKTNHASLCEEGAHKWKALGFIILANEFVWPSEFWMRRLFKAWTNLFLVQDIRSFDAPGWACLMAVTQRSTKLSSSRIISKPLKPSTKKPRTTSLPHWKFGLNTFLFSGVLGIVVIFVMKRQMRLLNEPGWLTYLFVVFHLQFSG